MKNNSPKNILDEFFGEFILLAVTLIWGATFVIIKVALDDISNLFFVFIRFSIASIILFPFVAGKLNKISSRHLYMSIFLGLLLFLGFASQTIGLKLTLATNSGFITGSAVIFIPIVQIIIMKKMPGYGAIVGCFIVLAGLLLLSSAGTSLQNFISGIGANFNLGDFLTLLCALFFAVQVVYLDIASKEVDSIVLVFIQVLTTAILSLILSVVFSFTGIEPIFVNFSFELLGSLLYTAILATVISLMVQAAYQKKVGPVKAGIIYSFEPIFAAVLAYFVLNERLSFISLAGCALIFLGLVISEIYDRVNLPGSFFRNKNP